MTREPDGLRCARGPGPRQVGNEPLEMNSCVSVTLDGDALPLGAATAPSSFSQRTRGQLTVNPTIRQASIVLLLVGLVALAYIVISPFLIPIAWAVIVSYVTWPLHRWIRRRVVRQRSLSAAVTTLILGTVIVVPLIAMTVMLQRELFDLVRALPAWLEQKPELPAVVSRIPYFGIELERVFGQFEDLQGLLRQHALPWLKRIGTPMLGIMTNLGRDALVLVVTLFTVFFLYRDGFHLVTQIKQVFTQVLGERLKAYFETTEATVKAVVYGIVLTALAQGFLSGLGYWAVGIKAPIVLGIVTTFVAMIPFGTPFVWGSASLGLLVHGDAWAGVALALWGTLVVSWVDNIIRPLVISSSTRIPFVLVMFGVLGGLTSFGFIGLFMGPVILGMALAVWREWLLAHDDLANQGNRGAEPDRPQ